jgi:hypothetical protein
LKISQFIMAKTYRNLYPQVCDWENIEVAYRKARL